jgi:molybdopterin-guanine dinucleotide biosynthesis protein A
LTLKIKPYVLAGGKSSRMGRDKAMLELEGKTLLERAVETLRSVKELQSPDGGVEVTICGEREALEGADRAIVDRYPSCGPLGGIEAALNDLATRGEADWAFFIPVDMPLLTAPWIGHLLTMWATEAIANKKVEACLVELDGRPQPLVSLVHRSVLGPVREALDSGRYKVVPVLQSAGACCTSFNQEPKTEDRVNGSESNGYLAGNSSDLQWVSMNQSHLKVDTGEADLNECSFIESCDQFINVNTETDLKRVATLLRSKGSNKQPESPAR